jgi:hypothetical protein
MKKTQFTALNVRDMRVMMASNARLVALANAPW